MAATVATTLFANAQGTWKASGTGSTTYAAATELGMGINNLQVMHSDASGITDISDTGASSTEYNGITYDNLGYIQGTTNGMFYAFLPATDGTLDIALKMSSGKKTFIYELTDAGFTGLGATDLTTLTTKVGTADDIMADATYFTTPSVYDTYNNSSATWDGSTAIQSTGSTQYMVISFPVTAGKTYAVGCFSSKLMIRGVNYVTSGGTSAQTITKSATVVKTEYYNVLGVKLSKPANGVNIVRKLMSDGSVVTSKTLIYR